MTQSTSPWEYFDQRQDPSSCLSRYNIIEEFVPLGVAPERKKISLVLVHIGVAFIAGPGNSVSRMGEDAGVLSSETVSNRMPE